MKLKKAHVTNFRCILDSNEVEIGGTTCLVGKNEAGKTAFLKALEGLRSVDTKYKEYNRTEDYPRRLLAEYEGRHKGGEARVVRTEWELEDEDKAAIAEEFGNGVMRKGALTVTKYFGSESTIWEVPLNEGQVVRNLVTRFGLTDEEAEPTRGFSRTAFVATQLDELGEHTPAQSELRKTIGTYRKNDAVLAAIDLLSRRMPRFLYFSHYDRMSGAISIDQLNRDRGNNAVDEGDQVFLDFLEYAGTNLDDLTGATRFEEMNAKCEAAANRITDQIFEYWTQNDQLSIEVRLDAGKSEDEPPFNSGTVARARVRNNLHRVTVPFSERSAGFIWFFSFLVKFAQLREHRGNVIILLDEPGLTLHGTAQKDLLRYFKAELEPNHQLIYTTHSPFMVPANDLSSVRTVEDVVVLDERNRQRSEGTKIRRDVLTTDPQTNFPVFGAMGFEVTQGLIISPNTLLVEGPSDILYLQAVSKRLQSLGRTHLDPRWAICPSGGIDKILPFVRLFHGNRLNTVVLTDFDRGQRRKLDDLYRAQVLEKERIILVTEIAGQDEADIEDLFDRRFYVDLLNATYDLKGRHRLGVRKLGQADETTDRAVKKAEAYFRLLPNTYPEFSHFDPAMHLLRNPGMLEADTEAVANTLDRFEVAFERVATFSNLAEP